MSLDIPIYCLTMLGSERHYRMVERFITLNLHNIIYYPAITREDAIIEYYLRERWEWTLDQGRMVAACMISHLSMIREFVKTGKPYAVIMEDDVILSKTFCQDVKQVIDDINTTNSMKDIWIILLSYLNIEDKIRPTTFIYDNYSDHLWGTQMYLLTRDGAMNILEKYDRPFYLSCPEKPYAADHTITKVPEDKRRKIWPMLGVEEGLVNTTDQGQIDFHGRVYKINYDSSYYL